jgi:hypothetical protein
VKTKTACLLFWNQFNPVKCITELVITYPEFLVFIEDKKNVFISLHHKVHRINSQPVFTEIPGNGLVPLLHGVLASKTPITDVVSDFAFCGQESGTAKQPASNTPARMRLNIFMTGIFVKLK